MSASTITIQAVWVMQVAPQNVLSVTVDGNTTQMRDYLNAKTAAPGFATIVGLNGTGEVVMLITFPVTCLNSVYEPEAEPTPVSASLWYNRDQINALFANLSETLSIPSDWK